MADRRDFFQGSELPRLLLLAVLAVAGWAWVWNVTGPATPTAEDPVRVEGKAAPVVPDRDIAFESVTDKTPLGLGDNAAYDRLLRRAREKTPEALAAEARRDVAFTNLWDRPDRYRGVPVHILGSARRVLRYDSNMVPGGWLYEAWVFTPESQNHPYVCVFETAPEGFPVGDELAERVVFNGYFLKQMKYRAGDTDRGAPLLIGKVGWTPRPRSGTGAWSIRSTASVAAIMSILMTLSLLRWLYQLRKATRPRSRPPIRFDRPNDEIAPEALAEWVEGVAEETDRIDELRKSPEDERGSAEPGR